jgi:hypothetical protein
LFSHRDRDRAPPEPRSLELHATTSFAQLLSNKGKRDEARAMLAQIYGWFTEGFDTAISRTPRRYSMN